MSREKTSTLIKDVFETILSLLVLLPVFAIFVIPVLLVVGLCRLVLAVYLRVRYGNSIVLMSVMDAAWVYETPTSTSNCHGIYVIKGNCVPEKIRENAQKMSDNELYRDSSTRCIMSVCGFPCWKQLRDDEINLEKYVEVVPRHEGQGQGPAKMEEIFEFLSSNDNPTPPDQALWKIYVFPDVECPDFTSKGEGSNFCEKHYAVAYRISHAVMDGISCGNLLHNIIADKPFKFIVDPCQFPKPCWLSALVTQILGVLSIPRAFFRGLIYSDRNQGDSKPLELTGPKTMSWSRPINFEAVKDIKKRTKTNVMSILLSCLGGAFHKTFNFPPSRNIIHALVTSILLPYPKDRSPSNRVSGVNAPVSMLHGKKREETELLSTEVERLWTNHDNLIETGRYSSAALTIANSFYIKLIGFLPIWTHRPISMGNQLSFSISNVPGPAEDIYMYEGDRVVEMAIWLPIKFTTGLGVGAFTYKNRLRVSFIFDGAYFPGDSFSVLVKKFEQELMDLGHSVGVKDVFLD